MTYTYTKNISLPGITIHLMEGKGGMPEDTPFIEDCICPDRKEPFGKYADIQKAGDESKTLPQQTIEEKLENYPFVQMEAAINELG